MNVPLNDYKIFHSVEVQIGKHRQESGHRVRRETSDIRSKYFFSVTHRPKSYPLNQFSSIGIPKDDNSDVSASLKSYALFVKREQPGNKISNSADEVSGAINVEQENSYDVRPDDLHEFGLDSSEYELKKDVNSFYDDHLPEEYIWQDHQHLRNEDDYKHHDDSHLLENHEGNFENHDRSEGEIGQSNYGFKTSFHKGFHGSYDDAHHSNYYDGNNDEDTDHHDENFVFEDYDHIQNYGSGSQGEELDNDQDHRIRKANGFYKVFHKDEFKKARDFYTNANEDGRFYKSEEDKKRFDDSEGKIKKEGRQDLGERLTEK